MERNNDKKKIIATFLYIAYWVVAYLQGEHTLLATVLIASMFGYVFLGIIYESIDNRS